MALIRSYKFGFLRYFVYLCIKFINMGRPKKYFTEEEKLAAKRKWQKEWAERNEEYYKENREKRLEQNKLWRKTPIGRATQLVSSYRRNDKKYNRGECTLTKEWIVENIFSKPCHYCGETDWLKIGCDRIDNSKPHTPDNVVPCCAECNKKRQTMKYEEFCVLLMKGK